MNRFRHLTAATLVVCALPLGVEGQLIFDWPLRAAPQPEPVVTGAGAVFWNPGSLIPEVGTSREVFIIHVDGPDATGVGGVALSGVTDLPMGFHAGVGYWHLGVKDIPRTTTSPHHEIGEINVSEDVMVVSLARSLAGLVGIGGGFRLQRGTAGEEARSRIEGEIGVHHQSGLPLSPRFGLTLRGLGGELKPHAGTEVSLPPLASSRIPIRVGYGVQTDGKLKPEDHRISLRGSWMDQVHLGTGFSYLGEGNGWTSLWMIGAEIGRFSVSILRESLANGFGSIHFFQGAVRFP